ncbi:hypothetical protein BABINDRAFT_183370 [Babjeviella inositovora NRRL Y-12698]|uniref:Uncharacterized protein n=1 Tax=Babjeviella inositovora NRRL Y-12698 TaxID=984486 RepID=A0A1E3QRT7_9ASCO|nr:uncharacterized protein BABINDRAFT_183370 [Babjeviella inositovora NRRL Y-12698]ODQ80413.1 hypothetical protein BABINDRAFT_183370 [Babjeviella inositovora NRRL Y-12698]
MATPLSSNVRLKDPRQKSSNPTLCHGAMIGRTTSPSWATRLHLLRSSSVSTGSHTPPRVRQSSLPNPLLQDPFNYVTLEKRISEIYRRYPRMHKVPIPPQTFIQVIEACRELEKQTERSQNFNSRPVFVSKDNQPSLMKLLDFQGKYKSSDVETKLLGRFLARFHVDFYEGLTAESPIKAYITGDPVPAVDRIILVFRDIPTFSRAKMETKLAFTALRVLLQKHNDYYSAFKLIDETVNHKYYLLARESMLLRHTIPKLGLWYAGFHGIIEISSLLAGVDSTFLIHYNMFMLSIAYLSATASFLMISNMRTNFLLNGNRVRWRSSTSISYRIYHHNELKMMDRIVVAFEETMERNPMNFHLGRDWVLQDILSQQMLQQGIILEEDVSSYQQEEQRRLEITDPKIDKLRKHIHHQLRTRRMMLQEDELESMFKEYWMKGGDGFEWAEPDQDPAEMERVLKQVGTQTEPRPVTRQIC